jgi:hypothetical protein
MTFGVEVTPFRERPSIDVQVRNAYGEPAGSLTVIETLTPDFNLTFHLRDRETADPYELTVTLYYATPDTERMDVDRQSVVFSAAEAGERLFQFEGAER